MRRNDKKVSVSDTTAEHLFLDLENPKGPIGGDESSLKPRKSYGFAGLREASTTSIEPGFDDLASSTDACLYETAAHHARQRLPIMCVSIDRLVAG